MELLRRYLGLCWFRHNPTHFQPSESFIWKCVAFYLVSGIIVEANISDPADATLEVAMRAIVAVLLITGILYVLNRLSQFKQLLTAIFVCENFIVTLGIGVEILEVLLRKTAYQELPTYLGVLLVIWYLAIISYILKRLFDFEIRYCIILSIGYFSLTYGGPFVFMEML
jgi:hypothetical protein